ncbi:MAG: hypothetical protein JSR55_03650 [Proteobacteria bacterium]|nr:hypothetical protein [Pseudomonadota bacterium]
MTKTTLLIPLAASLMLGTAAFAQSNMDPRQSTNGGMPIDQETSVNGIQAACTGVGDQQENNARWSAYPVKVVVSGTGHQFFAGETVSVTKRDGTQVAQMTCNAPWVLMKLQPGAYHATVDLPGHGAKTVAFNAPARGQREVNVVYTGQQEASDQTSLPPGQHRATDTSFTQPQAKPMDNNSTAGNGAVDQKPMTEQDMKNSTMDQSPNNSDQPPQPK